MQSQLEKVREEIARALGESPEAIEAEAPRWLDMMQEGVLVQLHIGRWRAKARLTWGDLGIELDDKRDKNLNSIVNLGYKKLLPPDLIRELDAIDSKARKWLEKKSLRTHWGFFVPFSAYADWKAENEQYRIKYFETRDRLVSEYDEIASNVLLDYRVAAYKAYRHLKLMYPARLNGFKTKKEFIESFVANIKSHQPTAEEIRESFRFSVDLRYIPLPSQLAADQAEAERQRTEREKLSLERQATRQQAELAMQAERDQAAREERVRWEKSQAEIRAARTAADIKEQQLREMNRDLVEQARQQKQQMVDGFLKDVVVQLRSLVYEASTDVLAAIQKKETLPPRSVVQLKKLVEQVQGLNFYGDADVERIISTIETQVKQESGDRNLNQLEENLKDIATVVKVSLINLGEAPRQARNLGIADEPDPAALTRARRGLGLAEITPAPAVRQARLLTTEG